MDNEKLPVFMTGVAEVNIKLVKGMDITGYLARIPNSSSGIHDELKVKCVIFYNGLEKYALVMCDLLGLSYEFIKKTAGLIGNNVAISADNIIIGCTHTHSGPASIFLQGCGDVNEKWMKCLSENIVTCVKKADAGLTPSSTFFATGTSNINSNRVTEENASGSRDNQVGVLYIRNDLDNTIKTMIVNYACHPVALEEENRLISSDYPYYMQEALTDYFLDKPTIVFTNGCCGDLNPVERGGFNVARRLGEDLAESIKHIDLTNLQRESSNLPMEIYSISVEVPLVHDLNDGVLEQMREEYSALHNQELNQNSINRDVLLKLYQAYLNWINKMVKGKRDQSLASELRVEIKLWRIGSLVFVFLPFEVFHDIGKKIKKHFGEKNTIVIGYANGNFGYLPSKELYNQAKYEVEDAYKFYGYPGPVSEDAEDIVLKAIREVTW